MIIFQTQFFRLLALVELEIVDSGASPAPSREAEMKAEANSKAAASMTSWLMTSQHALVTHWSNNAVETSVT